MAHAHLFELRPESMTILTAVTDIIAHKAQADFDSHHLTLCACVSRYRITGRFGAPFSTVHGMMGDQGISNSVIPHGLGESICDMSLVWCGVIRDHLRVPQPIPC